MPSTLNPAVPITLDKERLIEFEFNSFIELEEQTGKSAVGPKALEFWNETTTAKQLRYLLWAGLIKQNPELTLKQAGSLINGKNYGEIENKIQEAMKLYLGQGSGDNTENPPTLPPTTGSGPGPSPVTTSE